jgi:hypothetical protein
MTMQADPGDRLQEDTRSRHSTQTLVMAIAVLILAGGAYLLAPGDPEEEPPQAAPPSAAELEAPAPPQPVPDRAILDAPDIPQREAPPAESATDAVPEPVAAPAPPPEPTPQEVDTLVRETVAASGIDIEDAISGAYSAPWLIDRAVAASDQIARGLVPRRTLNLARPDGEFPVTRDGQRRFVDPAGYRRYDRLVGAITSLPAASLAELFHRFRPQLRGAYGELGYPPEAMDNALVAALDQIISTPVLDEPVELRSKGALYAYVDPALEGASDVQKQLLRSGPENTRQLQRWARTLRATLLKPD